MTTIKLTTSVNAPMEDVFNISRDIDFHKHSASQTQEKAIAGVQSGLIAMGETVTWRGKHFGIWLTHKSIISAYKYPSYFVDEMVDGNFKSFKHQHYFIEDGHKTMMKDVLSYTVPYGFIGMIIDYLFLKRHLTHFLKVRNESIKQYFS